jgi:hypothetical protein
MTDELDPRPLSKADELSLACLAHFDREEEMLAESAQVLRDVRRCLLTSDLEGLAGALQRQREAAGAAVELARRRRRLRERLCGELGVPEEQFTLRTLADRSSGGLRERLLASRQSLLRLAGEIEQVNRGNQALIRQSVGLLHSLLGSLSDQGAGTRRYTALGGIEPGGSGSLFQSRC